MLSSLQWCSFFLICWSLLILPVVPGELKSLKADAMAPLYSAGNSKPLPGRYIVRLKNQLNDGVASSSANGVGALMSMQSVQAAQEAHRSWLLEEMAKHPGSKLEHNYDMTDFVGYSAEMDDALVAKVRKESIVEFVEMDQPVWAFDQLVFDRESESFVPVGQGAIGNVVEELMADLSKGSKSAQGSVLDALRDGLRIPQKKFDNNKKKSVSESGDQEKMKYVWNKIDHHGKKHQNKHEKEDSFLHSDPGKKIKCGKKSSNCSTQSDAPWGLSRVSSKKLPQTFGKFVYPSTAGKGVDVYIVDTGINVEHEDFEGRATWGITVPAFDMDIDGNGHGTHCAGTVGSKTYGIAKKAHLIAVKVLRTNGFGTNADVIKGIEWVVNQHQMKSRQGSEKPRSVINMSLGGGKSVALERVVDSAVASGVHFAVAAGNDNADACNYSPAGAESAITAGASTNKDKMAYFSNNGPCVNLFAPGLDITSTWIGSKVATNTISGTSMASPHVAGVIALYLGVEYFEPAKLKKLLIDTAVGDALSGLPTNKSPNLLLNIHSLIKMVSSGVNPEPFEEDPAVNE